MESGPFSRNIPTGTLDGDRLPGLSATKKGGVPATGTPSGAVLTDGGFVALTTVTANRVYTTPDTTTLTVDCGLYDIAKLTALVGALTIANPTGTPADTQPLMIELKGDGGAITYGNQFVNRGATKPATATSGKWVRICCEWSATETSWDVVAVVTEA